MSRVLHIVRGSLPEGIVGAEDLVVYTDGALLPPGITGRLWRPNQQDQDGADRMSSDEVCELVFACERVVIW